MRGKEDFWKRRADSRLGSFEKNSLLDRALLFPRCSDTRDAGLRVLGSRKNDSSKQRYLLLLREMEVGDAVLPPGQN